MFLLRSGRNRGIDGTIWCSYLGEMNEYGGDSTRNLFKGLSKGLLLAMVLCGAVVVAGVSLAALSLTFHMGAPTQSQALGLYVDNQHTVEINPVTFNWGSQGFVISNGTTIPCYAFLSENTAVTLNVTVIPLTNVSCSVVYSPVFFQIASNATQAITMTFSNVVSNTTATWSFSLTAIPA